MFINEVIIAGNSDEVVQRLRALRRELGNFATWVLVAHAWDDEER